MIIIRENKLLVNLSPDLTDNEDAQLIETTFQAQLAMLQSAISELPFRKKQAFQLCKLEGKSYEEAGKILGISSGTVQEYVKTSSQAIRKYIHSRRNYSSLATIAGLAAFISL